MGRHTARTGGFRRVGDVILAHPLPTGAVVTAALVAALAVTALGTADRTPAPAHPDSSASGAAPAVALSVPNVVGLSESRATDALRARGFSTEFRTESGEPAAGEAGSVVIRQSPGAGAWAAKGTRIALTVAPAGSGGSTPPPNAGGSTGSGAVPAPAGPGSTSATGAAEGGAGVGNAGASRSGGAAPAPVPPVPAPAPPAPAQQPPAAPPPAPAVTPPPAVPAPTPPAPSLPLPPLPGSPLGVVGGLLRSVV
ncbi:PASTA domain-containing protein [Leifsonia shinshuensis]